MSDTPKAISSIGTVLRTATWLLMWLSGLFDLGLEAHVDTFILARVCSPGLLLLSI